MQRFLVAGSVAVSLALSACGEQAISTPAAPPPVSVTVTPVTKTSIVRRVDHVAQVVAVEDVAVRARVQGFIAARNYKEGDPVQKDQVLFLLDQAPYEAEVARAESELARAKAELTRAELAIGRTRKLRATDTVSQARLDDDIADELAAIANVAAAEAALRRAKIDLAYTEIKAPVAGRAGRSKYSLGDLVGPDSGELVRLVSTDPVYVYWTVREEIVLRVRKLEKEMGDAFPEIRPKLLLPDGEIYDHYGEIDFVDVGVDERTGTQSARAVFPNPDEFLVPGQYVNIILEVGDAEDALVIPQAAVQEDQTGRFVLVVDQADKVEPRPVDLGQRKGIFWVVEEGLAEGERVIYQGVQKVRPGMTVAPVERVPAVPVEGSETS